MTYRVEVLTYIDLRVPKRRHRMGRRHIGNNDRECTIMEVRFTEVTKKPKAEQITVNLYLVISQ